MAIKDANLAIVVEGNMDVIACHQAGFKNVVASSGTALTIDQLKILIRYSPDIAFSFDSDNAGQAAMKKAVALALQNDISTKIISLPLAYKDPDEAIKANPKHWSEAVEMSKPSLEHWIDLLIKNAKTLDVSTKKNIAREILPIIKIIYSDIEKEHYIKYLSMRLGISEKSLNQALDKSKSLIPETKYGDGENGKEGKNDKKSIDIYARLAGVIWEDLKIKDKIENIKNVRYPGEDIILVKFYDNIIKDKLSESIFNDEEKNQLNQISLTVLADFDDKSEENLLAEAEYLIKSIERENREQIKQDFVQKIKQAEADGNRGNIKELMEELSSLIK
jgi:DNA primase